MRSDPQKEEENAPFFGSWKNIYIFVIASLAAVIIAIYSFSNYFG